MKTSGTLVYGVVKIVMYIGDIYLVSGRAHMPRSRGVVRDGQVKRRGSRRDLMRADECGVVLMAVHC